MSIFPPPLRGGQDGMDESNRSFDWRKLDETRPLDIEGHDIWIFRRGERIETIDKFQVTPPQFGDLDPNSDEPDPDVWPLDIDVGAPADPEDLVRVTNSFPEPHVAWVTPEHLEAVYGYDPKEVEVHAAEVPPEKLPSDISLDELITASNDVQVSMTLTDDRMEALRRVARLWNGDVVQGHHILLDKCPRWREIFGDLSNEHLKRLFKNPNFSPELIKSFRHLKWFEQDASIFFQPMRVLRRKVWWSPTLQAKTLINKHPELPTLRGDPREKLRHRVTVGLDSLYHRLMERDIHTYSRAQGYTVDVVAHSDTQPWASEVITDHNNWKLYRKTYRKLADLDASGFNTRAVFDSRQTAYEVMNHWHRKGLAELPTGPFNSDPKISWAQEKMHEAYLDEDIDWQIFEWTTTNALYRNLFESGEYNLDREFITSDIW